MACAALLIANAEARATTDEDLIAGNRAVPRSIVYAAQSPTGKYPIVIPTPAELRKMLKARKPVPGKAVKKPEGSGLPKDIPVGDLSRIRPFGHERCDRGIPTRGEFLRMLKSRPADARQIMERCNVDVSSISPIRQLPVQVRQLPQDTRQRPVGTLGR